MKIKKIAQICKRAGRATLLNYTEKGGNVRQWITEGRALWPVEGLPRLKKENLPALLELSEKQKNERALLEREAPPSICFLDSAEGEVAAVQQNFSVRHEGTEFLPLCVPGVGVRWIDRELLLPSLQEYPSVELTLRAPAGCRELVAVKAGFMLVALIAPAEGMSVLEKKMAALLG